MFLRRGSLPANSGAVGDGGGKVMGWGWGVAEMGQIEKGMGPGFSPGPQTLQERPRDSGQFTRRSGDRESSRREGLSGNIQPKKQGNGKEDPSTLVPS